MNDILKMQMSVRVLNDEGKVATEQKSVRDIILDPEGVHADDVLNALRFFCAKIIGDYEAEIATNPQT